MTEIHLKRLVNEAVLLHRDIAIRTDRLKTLKADLVREARRPGSFLSPKQGAAKAPSRHSSFSGQNGF